jgi:phosphoribosylformylglycinamidine (FGAM) synthase PurS component
LKIPDNTAYTALVALRRLGVEVERVERSEIRFFENGDVGALKRRIMADETVYNPNVHRLSVLEQPEPREGEVWIAPLLAPSREMVLTAWRLFGLGAKPVDRGVLDAAIDRLLCNPAIDRAITAGRG